MIDPPFPRDEQLKRFGFAWDSCHGFGETMDYWSFYQQVVDSAPPNSTIVEVGCYHGRSLICLALLAREANKGLQIVGVDNDEMGAVDRLKGNIARSGLDIRLITKNSDLAAREFADKSCWLVFIDAAHLHEAVKTDVLAWMPKVSDNGWLAGHDLYMHTVHQPVMAMFGDRIVYDERWQEIWIVPKCEPLADADIYEWRAARPPMVDTWSP